MKLKEWGNAIWYLFHTLAYKLKAEESKHANKLYAMVRRICSNLPCPKCREHAMRLLAKRRRVRDKVELERFLWMFHNEVNVSLKRKEMWNNTLMVWSGDKCVARVVVFRVQCLPQPCVSLALD